MLSDRVRSIACALILLQLSTPLAMRAAAQTAQTSQPAQPAHTTVVVFADRPTPNELWASLFSALRSGLANGGAETAALDQSASFVRGQDIGEGLLVDSAITVYLHGDCTADPGVRRTAFGVALGWVYQVDGRIQPFAHVDCKAITDVLAQHMRGLRKNHRTALMGQAMARVILHEWIHVATQRTMHAGRGIEKAAFGPEDLLDGCTATCCPAAGQ